VGVADDASPTGELDRTGRALEVAMICEALTDAGLSLSDVDGVTHATSSIGMAEYLGIHPRFTDSTNTADPATRSMSSTLPPPSPPGSARW